MTYWLLKSEPDEFGIDDLKARPKQIEPWDGIRNYQARNMLRDEMSVGDQAFFYHSNTDVPGIYGVMKVASEPYPDPTAFDKDDKHYDPKSDPDNPRWILREFKYVRKFKSVLSLAEMREHKALEEMLILRKGNRLSITPISGEHWEYINALPCSGKRAK